MPELTLMTWTMQCVYKLKLPTLDFEIAQYSHMLLVVSSEKEMVVIRLVLIAFYSFSSSQALCRKCGIKSKGTITALISNDMKLFFVSNMEAIGLASFQCSHVMHILELVARDWEQRANEGNEYTTRIRDEDRIDFRPRMDYEWRLKDK